MQDGARFFAAGLALFAGAVGMFIPLVGLLQLHFQVGELRGALQSPRRWTSASNFRCKPCEQLWTLTRSFTSANNRRGEWALTNQICVAEIVDLLNSRLHASTAFQGRPICDRQDRTLQVYHLPASEFVQGAGNGLARDTNVLADLSVSE